MQPRREFFERSRSNREWMPLLPVCRRRSCRWRETCVASYVVREDGREQRDVGDRVLIVARHPFEAAAEVAYISSTRHGSSPLRLTTRTPNFWTARS